MSDFRNWLLKQRSREDNIGKLATWAYSQLGWDGKQTSLKQCLSDNYPQGLKTFEKARAEFRSRPPSPKNSARGPYTLTYGSFIKTFQTKDDIREHFKSIKDSNIDKVLSPADYDATMALFKYHPTAIIPDSDSDDEDKEPIQIKIAQHAVDANYCYTFNGEEHSYQTAIQCVGHLDEEQRRKKGIIKKFKSTARKLVQDQMLVQDSAEHCDHVVFFTHLLYDWFLGTNISLDEIQFIGQGTERRFSNEELNQSWIDYHREHAVLRVISKEDNMARKPGVTNWFVLFT